MREACGGYPPGHGMLHGADACILGSRCWHLVARTLDVEGARGTRGAGVSLSRQLFFRSNVSARARAPGQRYMHVTIFIHRTHILPARHARPSTYYTLELS